MELELNIIFVISTVVGLVCGQTCAPNECSETSLPKPMGSGLSGYTPGGNGCYVDGTLVTYICTGTLIGPPSSSCTGGSWIPPVGPTCEAASGCTRPQLPSNGNITEYRDEYALYDRITYYCEDGYSIIGPQEAVCDSGGIWDPSNIPTCEASCTAPSIQNGGPNGTFVNGEVITYACDVNYTLIGVSSATCRDGLWDPTSVPECFGKCMPPIVANSDFDSQQDLINHGSSVIVDCDPGYSTGSSTSTTVTCSDGSLSIESPTCYENCPPLDSFLNGQVTGDMSPFYHTETVSFSCDTGFTLDGATSITCNDGAWDAVQPTCMGNCPDIVPELYSAFYGAAPPFNHGEMVTFTCYGGYEIYNGSITSTCQNGQWSSDPPFCTEQTTTTQGASSASTMMDSATTEIPSTSITSIQETSFPSTLAFQTSQTSPDAAASSDVLPTSLVTVTDVVTEIQTSVLSVSTDKIPSTDMSAVTMTSEMTSKKASSEKMLSEQTPSTDVTKVTSAASTAPGSTATMRTDVTTHVTTSLGERSTTPQMTVTSPETSTESGSTTSVGDAITSSMTSSPEKNMSMSTTGLSSPTALSSKGITEDQKVVIIVMATAVGTVTLLAIIIALVSCHHTRKGTSDTNIYKTNGGTTKAEHAYDNNGVVLVNTHV